MKKQFPCLLCERLYAEMEEAEVCERSHTTKKDALTPQSWVSLRVGWQPAAPTDTEGSVQSDGGSAFPGMRRIGLAPYTKVEDVPVAGMSLRDYFAAHAPKKSQAWFKPVMVIPRPVPIQSCSDTAEHDYDRCGEFCEPRNLDAIRAYGDERKKQSQIQWPYAWADAILKARNNR